MLTTAELSYFPTHSAWRSVLVNISPDGKSERFEKFVIWNERKWRMEVRSGNKVRVAVFDGVKLGLTDRKAADFSADLLNPTVEVKKIFDGCMRSKCSRIYNIYSKLFNQFEWVGVVDAGNRRCWVFKHEDDLVSSHVFINADTGDLNKLSITTKKGGKAVETFEMVLDSSIRDSRSLFLLEGLRPMFH